MAETASSAQQVQDGEAALIRAASRGARAIFEERETVDALEGSSGLVYDRLESR